MGKRIEMTADKDVWDGSRLLSFRKGGRYAVEPHIVEKLGDAAKSVGTKSRSKAKPKPKADPAPAAQDESGADGDAGGTAS